MSKSPLESTWLYHEIGRCYLELQKYQDARDFGEKSLAAAKEAEDDGWQLHASVLVAQSEGTSYLSILHVSRSVSLFVCLAVTCQCSSSSIRRYVIFVYPACLSVCLSVLIFVCTLAEDNGWQLHASVLVAQSEGMLYLSILHVSLSVCLS